MKKTIMGLQSKQYSLFKKKHWSSFFTFIETSPVFETWCEERGNTAPYFVFPRIKQSLFLPTLRLLDPHKSQIRDLFKKKRLLNCFRDENAYGEIEVRPSRREQKWSCRVFIHSENVFVRAYWFVSRHSQCYGNGGPSHQSVTRHCPNSNPRPDSHYPRFAHLRGRVSQVPSQTNWRRVEEGCKTRQQWVDTTITSWPHSPRASPVCVHHGRWGLYICFCFNLLLNGSN